MAETATLPARRSPLDGVWTPGDHGAVGPGGPGVTMTRRLGLSAVQLDARAGTADAVRHAIAAALGVALPAAGHATSGGDVRALWLGPDRWLLMAADGFGLEPKLRDAAGPAGGIVVDQGHGRAILRLEGPAVRDVLAKGTGVDLHPRAFAEHAVAQTGLFHLTATLDRRRGTGRFDVHVMRGFAVSLFESLCEAAAEYGYRLV
ncbi:MAG: sarcosine oxidase subunit gamma family protein [Thalassobaculum sp.]|uniref:sarcosine oxidase subunit gamma n=1 Tax=Thalassobaculum sp. TaxID=2022740 RepID=UPI0032ED5BCB